MTHYFHKVEKNKTLRIFGNSNVLSFVNQQLVAEAEVSAIINSSK